MSPPTCKHKTCLLSSYWQILHFLPRNDDLNLLNFIQSWMSLINMSIKTTRRRHLYQSGSCLVLGVNKPSQKRCSVFYPYLGIFQQEHLVNSYILFFLLSENIRIVDLYSYTNANFYCSILLLIINLNRIFVNFDL